MKKEYIYIGQYFHYLGKDLGIDEKKIGKTVNLKKREIQLNRTNSTIGYTYIAAWEVESASKTEDVLHRLLSATRLSANGKSTEWFEDPDNSLVDSVRHFMSELKIGVEVGLGKDKEPEVNIIRKELEPFLVMYNDKKYYSGNARKTLMEVCDQIVKDDILSNEELGDSYLFREESVHNDTTGSDYTAPLKSSNKWRVYYHLSNSHKIKHLSRISKKLNISFPKD